MVQHAAGAHVCEVTAGYVSAECSFVILLWNPAERDLSNFENFGFTMECAWQVGCCLAEITAE